MRRQGRLHCARDILSSFQLFPVDYFCRRYCIFEEDAIMTQQTTPRLKSVVATTTICIYLTLLCCTLPQAASLGSECYTITGLDYRGTQDKIGLPPEAGDLLKYTSCLLWNTSVESTRPRARERGIGDHNYCRNPDSDILPWCRIAGIQGSDGAWGYCHLPTCQVPGYLGCFPDRGSPSALDGLTVLHKDMTVGACIDFCRRNGYKYAGLEAGNACFCGNGGYDRYGTSSGRGTQCAHKCFGNRSQPCGGDGYVDVYRADIGSCGTGSPLQTQAGTIYSPGYPDYPASPAMMTSLGATESMMQQHRDRLLEEELDVSDIERIIGAAPKKPGARCEWKVDVHKASDIKMLIRKIDPKRKLGGIIEIEARNGAEVVVVTSSNSNVTSPIVWIAESAESRHDVDVVVPDENTENGNTGADTDHRKATPQWSAELAKRRWPRYTLPSSSFESKVSIKGGSFTVRFLRTPEIITALKSTYELRKRSKNRRKLAGSEWSRFVLEYEASFPQGVTYDPNYDVTDLDVKEEEEDKNGSTHNSRRHNKDHRNKKHEDNKENAQEGRKSMTSGILGTTKFSISPKDARAIQEAVSASAGADSDSSDSEESKLPITIELIVEPVPGDSSNEGKTENKQGMSEFTIPLLLAVLLTTTMILILFAVLVIIRKGGLSRKKGAEKTAPTDYSPVLVVACPEDGDREKNGSNSNLSSSSTADSVLLTDSENSEYSKVSRKVSPDTIKDLMEFLRSQPGLIQSHPLAEADHCKQISPNAHFYTGSEHVRGETRHGEVSPLPGPCPHCCGCAEESRAHRHGDSCRAHHNLGKHGRPQPGTSARPSGGKNPRGLSIRTNKAGASGQPSLAPPLSPISEVSSVTSSMMSLPITSANSQTSLLKVAPKSSPYKAPRNDLSETGPESEALLTVESDAESGICDSTQPTNSEFPSGSVNSAPKPKFIDGKKGEKLVAGRYLGGIAGACYDSGYATSNYEEEEDKVGRRVMTKENKSFSLIEDDSRSPNNTS